MKRQIYLIPLFILFLSFFTLAQPTLIQNFESEYVLQAGNDYIGLIDFNLHFENYEGIIIQVKEPEDTEFPTLAATRFGDNNAYITDYEIPYGVTFVLYPGNNYIELDVLSSDENTNQVFNARVRAEQDTGTEFIYSDWYYFDIVVEGEEEGEPPEPAEGLLDGLVSYWKFDGDATDSHGTNDGTVNGATFTTGKINQGANFDGSDDITIAHDTTLNFNAYSLSLWVSSPDWNTVQMITTKFESSDNRPIYIFGSTTNQGINVIGSYSGGDVTLASSVLDNNRFYHLVVTADDSGNIKLYIDGVLVDSGSTTGTLLTNTEPLVFGSRLDTQSYNFNGIIDETAIWNRALNDDEVSVVYNDDAGLSYVNFETTPTSTIEGKVIGKDQNNAESPLRNVFVTLRDDDNNIIADDTTNANGEYRFTGVEVGEYSVYVNDEGVTVPIEEDFTLTETTKELNDYVYNILTPEQIASLSNYNEEEQEGGPGVDNTDANIILSRTDYFDNSEYFQLRYTYDGNDFTVTCDTESIASTAPPSSIIETRCDKDIMYIFTLDEGTLTNFRLRGISDVTIYDNNIRFDETNHVSVNIAEVTPEPPEQIQSFIPLSFDFDESINLQMNTYFNNYDSIEVSFFDEIDSVTETISIDMGGTTTSINKDHIFVELRSVLDDVILQIDSKQTELSTTFTVKAINEDGSVQDTFTFDVIEDLNPPIQIASIPNINLEHNDNTLLNMNNYFDNYDSFELVFIDEIASISETLNIDVNGDTQNYDTAYIDIELRSVLDDVIIEIDSKETNLNGSFTFRAINDDGSVEQSVPLTILEEVPQIEQIQSFINQTLGFNEELIFQFNNYFNNYDFIEVRFYSDNLSQIEEVLIVDRFATEQETFDNEYLNIELNSVLEDVILKINSKDLNFTTNFTIKAYQGVEFIENTFTLNISQKPPTLIGGVIDSFIDFLPSGEQFSNIQKIFIVIGILLISSIVMVVSFNFPFSLTTFINALIFTILVVLGFVPIGLLIVIILSIIGLIILRVR